MNTLRQLDAGPQLMDMSRKYADEEAFVHEPEILRAFGGSIQCIWAFALRRDVLVFFGIGHSRGSSVDAEIDAFNHDLTVRRYRR